MPSCLSENEQLNEENNCDYEGQDGHSISRNSILRWTSFLLLGIPQSGKSRTQDEKSDTELSKTTYAQLKPIDEHILGQQYYSAIEQTNRRKSRRVHIG